MSDEPSILLTNDDGIDAPGIQVLADELVEVADVTVLAPVEDQSGVGRRRSWERVAIEERDLGHALDGTPVDCVVAGVVALDRSFDLVVAGVNAGPNIGAHVLGRSGTVGAAIEAGFLGLPAIAVSMYGDDELLPSSPGPADFELAVAATRFLVERLTGDAPGVGADGVSLGTEDGPDYLNVNAPAVGRNPPMRVTRPSIGYEMEATVRDRTVELEDPHWDAIRNGTVDEPPGTDRRAVVDGEISVSPLSAPRPGVAADGTLVEGFDARTMVEKL